MVRAVGFASFPDGASWLVPVDLRHHKAAGVVKNLAALARFSFPGLADGIRAVRPFNATCWAGGA
jgi:hypothetical protein